MIEVRVGGLIPDKKTGSHVLLLKLPNSTKYLPIWIHQNEAQAIAMGIRKENFARPLTHDLLKSVVDGLGAEVTRIVITAIQESTYYARLILTRDGELISIDARPSDSVALAVRSGAPIFLTEELLRSQEENLYELEPAEDAEPDEGEPVDLGPALDELMRQVEKGERSEPDEPSDPESS